MLLRYFIFTYRDQRGNVISLVGVLCFRTGRNKLVDIALILQTRTRRLDFSFVI